jgi:hypothetical protein
MGISNHQPRQVTNDTLSGGRSCGTNRHEDVQKLPSRNKAEPYPASLGRFSVVPSAVRLRRK